MAQIGLHISISGYTGRLIIRWMEASAPLSEVGRSPNTSDFDFPYSDVFSITDINPVVHIVQLWRSDTGAALDELIKTWEIDALLFNEISLKRYEYVVGRGNTEGTPGDGEYWADPADTDTELNDERLAGATKEQLIVHEKGVGDYASFEYDLLPGGGIVITNGRTFDEEAIWFISHHRTITQSAPQVGSDAGSQFADVKVVTADRDFYVDASDNLYDNLVICNKAGSVLTITFGAFATIPNHKRVTFNTHGGSQKYLKLQFNAGDTVNWFGQAKNVIYVAKGQVISLYFFEGACYITLEPSRGLLRGTVVADMDSSRHTDTGAYLLADESTGVLNKADYPALYEFIENLPASHAVPLGTGVGQWSYELTVNTGKINEAITYPNKCKFGIDTTAETIRVPHLKNLGRRFVNTGENPGRYQHDAVGKFEAVPTVPDAYAHTGAPHEAQFTGGNNNNNMTAKGNSKFDTGNTETIMKNYGETPFIVL